ncbi:MAG: nitrogenase iron-molybdenum cofactor biosynthesis protein NifN [Polyangia bacterium]|jgi:nitrogenase molybdenum-iron protein NifN
MSCATEDEAFHATLGDATINPCTLCAPLGAALASVGIRDAVPLLHGAQGCATYIRRYLISHFREPMDVASSSFGESQTVFGGESNLHRALDNVVRQYQPKLVTVATTCLAEVIGEDVGRLLRNYNEKRSTHLPVVPASTPSFKDGHVEGYHAMVCALVEALATQRGPQAGSVNILPPILSPADLRHLREIADAYGVKPTILPDYSETLDGVILDHYCPLPNGGTRVEEIAEMPRALATLDLTLTGKASRASTLLAERGAPARILRLPIGIRACDGFCDTLGEISGKVMAEWLEKERGRLLDAYADGHKYVFGKRVAVYGDPELVAGLAGFLAEIGARPVLCATGARNRALRDALADLPAGAVEEVLEDTDFGSIETACARLKPELLIGSSKGYRVARTLAIPLLRAGFPIHDRLGAGRLLHVGYRGTMQLFDSVVNTLLDAKQSSSAVGFSYL